LSSSCKWAAPLAAFLQETNTEKQDEAYMADMINKIYEFIGIEKLLTNENNLKF